jgi:LCP family protein required for cell wall assembly
MSRYDDPAGEGWKQPRQRQGRERHKASVGMLVTGWLAALVVCALVIAALGAYVKYRTVWDSIKRIDATALGKQPPKYTNAENILLIGSDTRIGGNSRIGGVTGCNCSDTVMLLHISPGHHIVTVISIPRDTEVPIVACPPSDGTKGQQAQPGALEPINYALEYGGPICTWKTVDAVTRIHVDHFVQLDFTGFEKVINDIGGVNVCLPEALNVSKSGLHLSAGRHHVYGYQALAFWRTRENVGEGSDPQRIQRDQFLMASLVQGIEHSGMLKSPSKMLKVVGDVADAMTTDNTFDQSEMLQIADSLRGLTAKSVQFITAPFGAYPQDPNRLEFQQPQANNLFHAIAHDTKLPKTRSKSRSKSLRPGRGTTAAVVDTPSKVSVQVLNGAGIHGLAGQAASDLTSQGFNIAGTGNAENFSFTNSVVEYASNADRPAANTVAAQVSGATLEKNPSLMPGTVELIVGSNFSGLSASSPSGSGSARHPVSELSTTFGGITGNTRICADQAAFAGPDNPGG